MPSVKLRSKPIDLRGYEPMEEAPHNDIMKRVTGPGVSYQAPNYYLRTPLPSALLQSPDSLRQFYNGSTQQTRMFPILRESIL